MKWRSIMNKKIKNNMIQIIEGVINGVLFVFFSETMVNSERFGFEILFYYFIMSVVSYLLHIMIHEGGHCLFGLLNDFKFVSFRIGSYMWSKENDKIKFSRYKLAKTGGQCLMMPPLPNLKKYILYNVGGGSANLIVAVLFLLLGIVIREPLFNIFCVSMIVAGFLLGLMNLIPLDVGVANDGLNILFLIKDKKSIESMYQQLVLAKELADGKRPDEIDGKYYTLYEGANLENPLNTCIASNYASYLLATQQYDDAKSLLDEILSLEISELFRNSAICDRILAELLTDCNQEVINRYLDEKMKKKMNMNRTDISSLLMLYGIDVLVNHDHEQALVDLKYYQDACQMHPYAGVVQTMNEFKKMIDERKEKND